jgi:uncharacterized protein YhaN
VEFSSALLCVITAQGFATLRRTEKANRDYFMEGLIEQFLEELQSPDISSSVGPLVIVITAFLVISAGLIYFIVKMIRVPTIDENALATTPGNEQLVILNTTQRLTLFFKRFFTGSNDGQKNSISLSELEMLRKKIARLEKENLTLRDNHARAVSKLDEYGHTVELLQKANRENTEALEKSQSIRTKLQKRNEELEQQVAEMLTEMERKYRADQTKSGSEIARTYAPYFDQSNPAPAPMAEPIPIRSKRPPESELEKSYEKSQLAVAKLQKRNEDLEVQLNELLVEVERLYRANMQAEDAKVNHPPFFEKQSEQQLEEIRRKDEQIKQLKELLMVCRSQIEAYTQAANRSPEKRRA